DKTAPVGCVHLNGQGDGPYPAMVTQTFSGPYVNLKVLGWGKDAWDEGSVSEKPVAAPDGEPVRYWTWPPRE
ncbi:hypothetical protein, partial [Bradyrhizobium pachyrhizi]|uniref:hypothetical protein n=1 Tax=Bradyrhizobium pachyrhizi TaxID=280333 RepID=UPI000ABA2F24